MLSAEDNRLLTRATRARRWASCCAGSGCRLLLSEELPEADGVPKKVTVMGEPLLAFRDTRGRVGLIDQHCPHRGANLWLGRNEECGIRCVYHGWKFDVDGRCVDMPTSYPDLNAKDKIRIKAYPAREQGGMIWAYMGPPERMPKLPALEVALVPASHRYVSKKWQDCNWVQAHGRQHRHRPLLLRAPDLRQGRGRGPRHPKAPRQPHVAHELRPRALDRRRSAPRHQGQRARCRPRRCRRTHRARRQHLLAHRPVPDAHPRLRAERHAGREHVRAVVRAGHRHQLLDLHLRLEPRAAHHRSASGRCTGAATASSPRSTRTTCPCAPRPTTT